MLLKISGHFLSFLNIHRGRNRSSVDKNQQQSTVSAAFCCDLSETDTTGWITALFSNSVAVVSWCIKKRRRCLYVVGCTVSSFTDFCAGSRNKMFYINLNNCLFITKLLLKDFIWQTSFFFYCSGRCFTSAKVELWKLIELTVNWQWRCWSLVLPLAACVWLDVSKSLSVLIVPYSSSIGLRCRQAAHPTDSPWRRVLIRLFMNCLVTAVVIRTQCCWAVMIHFTFGYRAETFC